MKLLPALLLGGCLCASLPAASQAAEYVYNGTFEGGFYAPGVPNFWKQGNGDGSVAPAVAPHVSPFTNLFSAGQYAMLLTDGGLGATSPNLSGGISSGSIGVKFALSFEFSIASADSGAWRLNFGNSGLGFEIGPAFAVPLGTAQPLMMLEESTWYQVNAIVDSQAWSLAGTLQPFGGEPRSFSGIVPGSGTISPGWIQLVDLSSVKSPSLYLDNVSVRTVPEPSTAVMLLVGLVGTLRRRRSTREERP